MGKINWTLRTFRLDELTDYYKNPRSLSEKEFKQLKTSLDKFGMIDKPIVNLDSANTIIGGHQRKHVMESTGAKEIECWIPDRELSEKEVEELNIRLNKNTGSWDFDTLANEFELDDLLDWGFDKGELDLDLWADEAPEDVEPQIDKAEELRVKWGVESGQLWQLGEHRLICGDCTDKAVVERVMGGERADITFTSPPYNAGKTPTEEKSGTEAKYRDYSDDLSTDDYFSLLSSFTNEALSVSDYAIVNIQMLAGNKASFLSYLWKFADRLADIAIWDKQHSQPAMARNVMNSRFEFVLIFGKDGATRSLPGDFRGTVDNVYSGKPQTKNDLGTKIHAATMPIDFAEWVISNFSTSAVFEPFCGSGTTLIACERLGRKCRAVEISPAYVAVAIQRWVDVTGGEPELIGED